MGWRINLVENDLTLPEAAVAEINALPDYLGASTQGNRLYFDPDHLEHMDYVWNDEVLAILDRNKVNGRILFSSSEGDNRGETWGYLFQNGKVTNLVRYEGNWVPKSEVPDGVDLTPQPTGNAPDDLSQARIGDTVAVGFIYGGLTSYERGEVGDILPDGAIVVDGREYRAPRYRFNSDMGASFVLKPVSDPSVDLEDEDEEDYG